MVLKKRKKSHCAGLWRSVIIGNIDGQKAFSQRPREASTYMGKMSVKRHDALLASRYLAKSRVTRRSWHSFLVGGVQSLATTDFMHSQKVLSKLKINFMLALVSAHRWFTASSPT